MPEGDSLQRAAERLRGGDEYQAVLWNGPVLELSSRALDRPRPDIMFDPSDLDGMISRFRADDPWREIGDALLDQRLVAGAGNMRCQTRIESRPQGDNARMAYWCPGCQAGTGPVSA